MTDIMSHSQFHSIDCLYLDMHGLIFDASIHYWQDQPDNFRTAFSSEEEMTGVPKHRSYSKELLKAW